MKYKILFFFFFLYSFNAYTQSFKAGFQLGMTATQVDGDKSAGYNKPGFFGGIFVNRPLENNKAWQLEMNFIQKGSRINVDPNSANPQTYLMRLNYLEVPVLFQKKIKKNFGFEAGGSAGYLISAKEYDMGYLMDESALPTFRKFEISGIAGMTYILTSKLIFHFRFQYSLTSIRPYDDSYVYMDGGQYNNVLCMSLLYKFRKDE